ncbi:MAG TPA: PhnD/SsuA/transferrin family substrate-binding protein, partial [Nitrososphaeraceae archaeon]|nr:PhnD/SsuA/transferrin family substrate-binding protein [Nitrososphaeraceae archaeon]
MLLSKMMIAVTAILLTVFILVPLKNGLAQSESNVTLGIINLEGDEVIGKTDIADKQRFSQDLINYVASNLGNGTNPNLMTVDNISAMVNLLKEQKVDLFIDSPFISALVDNKSGATPFLAIWGEKKPAYSSLIITKKSSPIIYHLYDLNGGKSIGFTSGESSVGYLLPKSFLIGNGVKFSPPSSPADMIYIFTGSENDTLYKVLKGTLDAGVLSSSFFNALPSSTSSQLKTVGKTMEIPLGIISHRSDFSSQLTDQLSNILMNMKTDAKAS